jgi:predicted transposase YdaD
VEGRIEGRVEGRVEGRIEGRIEGRVEGRVEGESSGRRAMLLTILGARGLSLSDAQRQRIEACDDLDMLEQWARVAVTASSGDALFADEGE